jgi:calmodulin
LLEKIYDTKSTGFINIDVLKGIFGQLGFGEITDEDVKIVIETADADGDGKIGLEDFRNLLTRNVELGLFKAEPSK